MATGTATAPARNGRAAPPKFQPGFEPEVIALKAIPGKGVTGYSGDQVLFGNYIRDYTITIHSEGDPAALFPSAIKPSSLMFRPALWSRPIVSPQEHECTR